MLPLSNPLVDMCQLVSEVLCVGPTTSLKTSLGVQTGGCGAERPVFNDSKGEFQPTDGCVGC